MRVLIRDFRSDERAVASTVGTVMALLVFLTFLSVIVNQYVPIWMKDTVAFDYMLQGVRKQATDQSSGAVVLTASNRYYTPQRIVYENGAVIRYQTDGQFVRVHPTFSVLVANNSLDISFALVSLYGKGIVTGTTTEMVSTELFAFDRQDYQGFPNNAVLWLNHTSAYGLSWYRFINQTLSDTLKLAGTYSRTALSESFTAKIGATTVYQITWTLNPTTGIYLVRLTLNNNPGVMRIAFIRLQHAQVQVGIGDATQQIQF